MVIVKQPALFLCLESRHKTEDIMGAHKCLDVEPASQIDDS